MLYAFKITLFVSYLKFLSSPVSLLNKSLAEPNRSLQTFCFDSLQKAFRQSSLDAHNEVYWKTCIDRNMICSPIRAKISPQYFLHRNNLTSNTPATAVWVLFWNKIDAIKQATALWHAQICQTENFQTMKYVLTSETSDNIMRCLTHEKSE